MQESLTQLIDRQAIKDVIYRYARGVDRMDSDLIRSCYHPDALDDHGTGVTMSVDQFIEWAIPFLRKYVSTMHLMANILVEFDGDLARVETYAVAYHRLRLGESGAQDLSVGVRYVDRFARRDGEWRIANRVLVPAWRRLDDVPSSDPASAAAGNRVIPDPLEWIMTVPQLEGTDVVPLTGDR